MKEECSHNIGCMCLDCVYCYWDEDKSANLGICLLKNKQIYIRHNSCKEIVLTPDNVISLYILDRWGKRFFNKNFDKMKYFWNKLNIHPKIRGD
jgi:hypothetical protein